MVMFSVLIRKNFLLSLDQSNKTVLLDFFVPKLFYVFLEDMCVCVCFIWFLLLPVAIHVLILVW